MSPQETKTDSYIFRELTIPEEWRNASRVRIHFEAVDYHTTVYIDKGTIILKHRQYLI